MNDDLVASASTVVAADRDRVWAALVDPVATREYMFGTTVASSWVVGEPITWSGEWNGAHYEDRGTILEFYPGTRLAYTHFSPMSGDEDIPENYHTVTIGLSDVPRGTRVALTQVGNTSLEMRDHSVKNWEAMLAALKEYVEGAE